MIAYLENPVLPLILRRGQPEGKREAVKGLTS
jgi:hypothetical protein